MREKKILLFQEVLMGNKRSRLLWLQHRFMALADGDIYHVVTFLDGISSIHLEASDKLFRRTVRTCRLSAQNLGSVRPPGVWRPAEDVDGVWPFLAMCDMKYLPTTEIFMRSKYTFTRRSDIFLFWKQMQELLDKHRLLTLHLQLDLQSTLSYHSFIFRMHDQELTAHHDRSCLYTSSTVPSCNEMGEAMLTAQTQLDSETMLFVLDFCEAWVRTSLGRLNRENAAQRQGRQDGFRLEGLCLLDVTIDLVCDLDDPGVASVAMTTQTARHVVQGTPVPFLFNLSLPKVALMQEGLGPCWNSEGRLHAIEDPADWRAYV